MLGIKNKTRGAVFVLTLHLLLLLYYACLEANYSNNSPLVSISIGYQIASGVTVISGSGPVSPSHSGWDSAVMTGCMLIS